MLALFDLGITEIAFLALTVLLIAGPLIALAYYLPDWRSKPTQPRIDGVVQLRLEIAELRAEVERLRRIVERNEASDGIMAGRPGAPSGGETDSPRISTL